MSDCKGGPVEQYAELYLMGTLSEMESARFEEHYFGCPTCHDMLLDLQAIQDSLQREPIAIPVRKRMFGMPMRLVAYGSIAAALVVGLVLLRFSLNGSHGGSEHSAQNATATVPSPDSRGKAKSSAVDKDSAAGEVQVAELADLQLPGYRESQLRGADLNDAQHNEFKLAMGLYSSDDCSGALIHLARVPAGTNDGVATELFTGLCELKGHSLNRAEANLAKVVVAGDTPQLETAEYFLAQVRLVQGDIAGANKYLLKTIALQGDYEAKARAQQHKLSRQPHN